MSTVEFFVSTWLVGSLIGLVFATSIVSYSIMSRYFAGTSSKSVERHVAHLWHYTKTGYTWSSDFFVRFAVFVFLMGCGFVAGRLMYIGFTSVV